MQRKYKAKQSQEITKEVYLYYIRYFKSHGYCPGYKEIAEEIGMSEYTAKRHTAELMKRGLLETDHPGNARAIRVTGYKFVKEKEHEQK